LGVSEASELPEFESIREKINDFKKQEENGTDRNHNEE
jgi:hypothetical protein